MPSRTRVALGFGIGIVGISFAALFVRWALPAPPVITGFYRMLIASVLLGIWVGLRRRGPGLSGRVRLLALGAGLCFGTDLALWHTALVSTSLANATFLVNTTPIYVGLASVLLYRERLGGRFAAGAALALAGTAVLVGADLGRLGAARGDLLALYAALFYSGYLLLMKAVRRGAGTPPALFVAGLGATAALACYGWLRGDAFTGFPASSWAAMVGAAVVAQLGGVMGVVWSLRFLRASVASVALLAQPVGTALLAWLLIDEALSGWQALGGSAVGAGIALASRASRDPDPPQANFRSCHQG